MQITYRYSATTPTMDIAFLDPNTGVPISSATAVPFYDNTKNMIGQIFFAGGGYVDKFIYLDNVLVNSLSATVQLTVQASSPASVTTVDPTVGTHTYNANQVVALNASRFVSCPTVYLFDHWVGNVADTHAADTTIVMNGDQTVQAVFVDGRVCGDECHPYPVGDFSHDCHVNLVDFGMLAAQWLYCTQPVCD